jgi:hypothetical protein
MLRGLVALPILISAAVPSGPDSVVSRVNGVPLHRWEAERELASRIPGSSYHGRLSPERQKELRTESLDTLVLKELKRQWAMEQKTAADEKAVESAWRKVRDRFATQSAYEGALKEQGLTDAAFRKAFERDEAAALADRTVRAKAPPPTEDDLKTYFAAHRGEYVRPEARHVALALVLVDPGGGDAAWKAGEEQAEALATRVRAGAPLAGEAEKLKAALPPKYRAETGDLGFVHRGSVRADLEKEIFDARIPSLRGPVRTLHGYQIVQVLAARPAEPLAYADVREAVAARIRREREKEALEGFEGALIRAARVERFEWASEP